MLDDTGDYEELLAPLQQPRIRGPSFAEDHAAATCYTSGTTGHPKGVLYTHRSLVLHSYGLCMADAFALSERDTSPATGPDVSCQRLGHSVRGGDGRDRRSYSADAICSPPTSPQMIETERVTFTAGVPTLWMGLYSFLEHEKHDISSLRTIVVRRLRAAAAIRRMVSSRNTASGSCSPGA